MRGYDSQRRRCLSTTSANDDDDDDDGSSGGSGGGSGGSSGSSGGGGGAVVPLRLATMLRHRRLARIVPPGWMDAGGSSRGGGDSRVTSGRRARSAESVAPIPGMVDDNIQGRRL